MLVAAISTTTSDGPSAAITPITSHQRPNSGGVYTIHHFARLAAALTDVEHASAATRAWQS
jgi:hypothetical protein